VQYYLIQLSYTAQAWAQQIATTRDVTRRLAVVKELIAKLGGSLARYEFFDDDDERHHVMNGKFVAMCKDDLVAILAMPDHEAALAFSMAVSAESGVRDICLTPITPISRSIDVMKKAKAARDQTNYSAPGGVSTTWTGEKGRRGRRGKTKATPAG
jgi:uncharacterized protein with GYD domain